MSELWERRPVPLKFMLSDKLLFKKMLDLNVQSKGLSGKLEPVDSPLPPPQSLQSGCDGYLIRSQPLQKKQPPFRSVDQFICYVPNQYQRYYINLQQSFDDYQAKFSSKSRSTIKRKIKKFAKQCGDDIRWQRYNDAAEMAEFYRLARQVSSRSYQEKLLDAGLPDSADFQEQLKTAAEQDLVRGYVLFDGDKPIAYMYCPIHEGILMYDYLGYDPDYMKWSVGTILHWRAFEDIFNEGKFRLFDFTEGESEHKRLYATDNLLCGNVYFLRKGFGMMLLLRLHKALDDFSNWLGGVLDRYGLKTKIKKFIRFGRQ